MLKADGPYSCAKIAEETGNRFCENCPARLLSIENDSPFKNPLALGRLGQSEGSNVSPSETTFDQADDSKSTTSTEPDEPLYDVGGLSIIPGPPKDTGSKTVVTLDVFNAEGEGVDSLTLSTAASNRKAVAKAIVARVGDDVDDAAEQVDAMLGKILVDARASLKMKVKVQGDLMRNILKVEIEQRVQFVCVTETGRAFDAVADRAMTRAAFIERFTCNELLSLVATAVDCPRESDGTTNRPTLMIQHKRELEFLWGDLTRDLPAEVEAKIDGDSSIAKQFCAAIIERWQRKQSWQIVQHRAAGDEPLQLAKSASLKERLEKLLPGRPGDNSWLDHAKWEEIEPGAAAWYRIKDKRVVLAMRVDLLKQIRGEKLPAVTDQRSLRRLGIKYGIFTDAPSVADRQSDGTRLAVLTVAATETIRATPDCDDAMTQVDNASSVARSDKTA